ncbi:unnamed protein product [Blepharisma stoltei]|uniref:Reverse transcriptase domain-containing protein n=1 Tax=Blepharisma stoltei TaxID=1481888 RepID=A0AAU9JWS9_9CILI|nr:unnamed protein product [Blepharisma stoltei]
MCFNLIPNELAWAIEGTDLGIQLGPDGSRLGFLLYADDIALLANNELQLQQIADICSDWARKYSLKINQQKSGVVDYAVRPTKLKLVIDGQQLRQVKQYKYLGKNIGSTRASTTDAKAIIEKIRSASRATKILLGCMNNLSITKKLIIAEACVTPVATYAIECAQRELSGAVLKCAENERMRLARMLL